MMAAVERALARLASPGATLAPYGEGYGVYPRGDRRRRPTARLDTAELRELEACGAIEQRADGAYVLSGPGRARVTRALAQEDEAYLIQHTPVEPRTVIDQDGDQRLLRGVQRSDVLRRLASLRDTQGQPWLSEAELAAARRVRSDWEASQAGLTRGSDWSAPPLGAAARAGNAQERAMAVRCDARRRVAAAMDALATPMRRIVERVCFHEDGLEMLERAEGWPARSGKLALKMGLAQLAQTMGR